MAQNDIYDYNDAGEMGVRVIQATAGTQAITNSQSCYTYDADGNLAVRVIGLGGGGGTGTVTSVNGVQPVAGNVEITGDNITATVGEEEATITQHLTTLQQSINGKQNALTTEQLAAVNSGITSAKVASYDAYAGEISTAQSTADKADGAAEVAQQTANLAGQNAAQALEDLKSKANTSDLPQNQTGTVGQVYTKTESGGAWQDAAGGDTYPKESDFIPVVYSATTGSLYGALSVNLGALADGVYEFYVKTKDSNNEAEFMRHYYRVTIADGAINVAYPNTYVTVAFTPGENGPRYSALGKGWAVENLQSLPFYCGKVGQNFIIESNINYPGLQPGVFSYDNIESGTVVAYVSRVRNVSSGQLFTPTITVVETATEGLQGQSIGSNPFGVYLPTPFAATAAVVPLSAAPGTKYLMFDITNALKPGDYQTGASFGVYPKTVKITIWSEQDTTSVLEFTLKSNRSDITIHDVQSSGIFIRATFAAYNNSEDVYGYGLLVTLNTLIENDTEYIASMSDYGSQYSFSVGNVFFAESIDSQKYTLIKNITPTPTITGTTVTTVDSVVVEDLGNGYIRMHGKLTEPTIAGVGSAQTPVVFPTGYTMANADYSIQLTGSSAEQTADVNVDFDTPATTGFNVDMKNLNATTAATNVVVHWTVFGKKATV